LWRWTVLQNRIDAMLALSEARAAMYAEQMEGSHRNLYFAMDVCRRSPGCDH
jgi:hypothetical protein